MGESTEIAWTDATFNPWWGCQRVSPGCEHCYAEAWAKRTGAALWGPTAERRFFSDKHWREPLKWNAAAEKAGKRTRVFCASMADVFEDRRDLDAPRARLFELIHDTPRLDWQLLTKRPENMVRLAWDAFADRWPDNVWAMTTCEDQERADLRIPHLLKVQARVRGVSYEPALGPVDFSRYVGGPDEDGACLRCGCSWVVPEESMEAHECPPGFGPRLDWIIVGGESGGGARPFDPAWAGAAVQQCSAAVVPVFVKQLGARPLDMLGGPVRLKDRKGADPAEWPAGLRVREFPS